MTCPVQATYRTFSDHDRTPFVTPTSGARGSILAIRLCTAMSLFLHSLIQVAISGKHRPMAWITLPIICILVVHESSAQSGSARVQVDWSSYIGGEADDQVLSVTADRFGHVYVAGRTSTGLRLGNDTTGQSGLTHQRDHGGGGTDAFLMKFAPQGSVLWATYFGGAGTDEAVAVVMNGTEGVYLVGNTTSTDSIATDSLAYQIDAGGGQDIFIAYFTEYGLLTAASYFGSEDDERATGAALDVHGRLLVGGSTNGAACLAGITPAAQQYTLGVDALLLRFAGTDTLIAGTFLGGEGEDALVHIATGDSSGTVFVGNSTSAMNIAMIGAMTPERPGGADGFVMKVDTNLVILHGTYFGGPGDDEVRSVAYRNGRTALCGISYSDTLYTDSTAYHATHAGGGDGFIAELDSSLGLVWCTFIGDTAFDALSAVRYDMGGHLYAAGVTASADGMASVSGEGGGLNGPTDAFVLRFDSAQTLSWSRYLGGVDQESTQALWVFGETYVFLGGQTSSASGFAQVGHQMEHAGGTWDGGATKLVQDISTAPEGICTGTSNGYGGGSGSGGGGGSWNGVSPPLLQFDVCLGESVQFMAYGGALGNGAEWMWYADECGIPEHFLTSGDTITITPTSSFTLWLRSESAYHVGTCKELPIVVHVPPTPVINVTDTVCPGGMIVMEGSGADAFNWIMGDSTLTGLQVSLEAPMEPGTYPIAVEGLGLPVCSVDLADTVVVTSAPIASWTVTDVSCDGGMNGSITLDSSSVAPTITWEPAAFEGTQLFDLPPGAYIATSTDVNGCTRRDSLSVGMPPPILDSVVTVDAACGAAIGAAAAITSHTGTGLSFDWGTGAVDAPEIEGLPPGLYTLSVSDTAGCTMQMGFEILPIGLIQVNIAMDTLIAIDGEATLQCSIQPADSTATYSWSPTQFLTTSNGPAAELKVNMPTWFTVVVTSTAGCVSVDSVLVTPEFIAQPMVPDPCGEAFLPDNFSPNGDGLNDALCLLGGCYTQVEWSIYDSWGQRVFASGSIDTCWDGTHGGSQLPAGSYAFTLNAERQTGDVVERSGLITLRR